MVYLQAFQLVLEEIQQKDQNPPCQVARSRVDRAQVVVDHRELGLVAEGRLSDPRLGSCRQVAVVTPLVAEVGRQVAVVTPWWQRLAGRWRW